jgi:hypothetical protein
VASVVSVLVETTNVETSVAVVSIAVDVSDSITAEVSVERVSTVEAADSANVLEISVAEEEKVAETAVEPVLSQLTLTPIKYLIEVAIPEVNGLHGLAATSPKAKANEA